MDLSKIPVNEQYQALALDDDIDEKITLGKSYLVSKVVDGDTIDVLVNDVDQRIRIIGLDTPEVVSPYVDIECFGEEASKRAREILTNQFVYLETDDSQDLVDKYGRWLRHIILINGDNFAEQMIGEGLAREYTYKVASKYQVDYLIAENMAKENKNGLWADGVCDVYDNDQ